MSNSATDNVATPTVVFAVLPFSQLSPALDASTLATILKQDGVHAKVVYLNRLFAHQIDLGFYHAASASISLNSLLGDWVFRDYVFGAMDDRNYLQSLIEREYLPVGLIPPAIKAKASVNEFLGSCLVAVDWINVKVLCLIETFAKRDAVSGQLMSSLALARMVKKTFPHVQIVLAGPSTEQEMGKALSSLSFLDFICTGNIYGSLPSLIAELVHDRSAHLANRLGVTRRKWNLGEDESLKVRSLNLPIPNFDDYFELRGDGLPGCFESIPMETSKGCWWAERSHCHFCALPGRQVLFRSKTPEKTLLEFCTQLERYRPKRIEMHDLIIDTTYFANVFPALSTLNHRVEIFYETKAHLSREQLQVLANAGITKIQTGIESLSQKTLKRMSKGVSVSSFTVRSYRR